jgi:hypothetical protein
LIQEIKDDIVRRGITRLCHFTPARNLAHILAGKTGVLASKHLSVDEREVFNPTDVERLDGYPDHVSCSIEYPNGWYFRKARAKERLFEDWVVILIKREWLWQRGTKFSRRNAAAGRGAGVGGGFAAFSEMFAPQVVGAYGKLFVRDSRHPGWLPTDEQAETLVQDTISLTDIIGIAVASESQAKRESARMRLLRQSHPALVVAPALFDANRLSSLIRQGRRPEEVEYVSGDQ